MTDRADACLPTMLPIVGSEGRTGLRVTRYRAMMRIELKRDSHGRPDALRVRFDGPGLLARARALRTRVPRRVTWSADLLAAPVRAVTRAILLSVPRVSWRRDDYGGVSALVLRFGVEPAAVSEPAPTIREQWSSLLTQLWNVAAGVAAWLPRPVLERDVDGEFATLRFRSGEFAALSDSSWSDAAGSGGEWVIEPIRPGFSARVQELWRHRRLLRYFGQRGVQRMYEGTNLGALWLFIRPLLPIFISTVIFGSLLGVPSEGVPYFLFFLAGTTNWMLFERSTLWATRSLEVNRSLIRQVYVPRLIVLIASVSPALVDAGAYSGLLVTASFFYLFYGGHWYLRLGPSLVLAAAALVLSVVMAIAVGLWTAVWQTRIREVRYTLRYVMRFWNYLTPVLYPLSKIPPQYHWLVFLNPMASFVEAFKWGVLGVGELNLRALTSGVVVALLMLGSGLWYFNRSEATAVDRL